MDIDLSALVHLRGCRDLLYIAGLLLRNLCFGLTRNDGRLLIRLIQRDNFGRAKGLARYCLGHREPHRYDIIRCRNM